MATTLTTSIGNNRFYALGAIIVAGSHLHVDNYVLEQLGQGERLLGIAFFHRNDALFGLGHIEGVVR